MIIEEIEAIKRDGSKLALYKKTDSLIWDAKNALERACANRFVNFEEQLMLAHQKMQDATALYKEWKSISD